MVSFGEKYVPESVFGMFEEQQRVYRYRQQLGKGMMGQIMQNKTS